MADWLKALFVIVIVTLSGPFEAPSLAEGETPAGPPLLGRYVGYLQVDGAQDAIAVALDYMKEHTQGDEFPHDVLHFRFGLGGYLSPEYESETFEHFRFDIDQALLVLNDKENEMMARVYVYQKPKVHLAGRAYLRTAHRYANLYVEYQDPKKPTMPLENPPKLIPSLAGQYEGKCGVDNLVLQLETGKGLTLETPVPTAGLTHYNITGTVGIANGLCPRANREDRPNWCVDHAFSSATYDFFQGKLTLVGGLETDECTRDGETLNCHQVRFVPRGSATPLLQKPCEFHKVNSTIAEYKVYPRKFHVEATPDQKKPLAPPQPPLSEKEVAAADGSFWGYLHNEYLDRYQPVRLDVMASATTPHPHIVDNIFVSVSSVLFFGDKGQDSWGQQFDDRILMDSRMIPPKILSNSFLKSDQSDAYLELTEWDQGYIAGIWYSGHFGKVGTFEVVKGDHFPALDPSAKQMPDISGHFFGPQERSRGVKDGWDLQLLVPRQPRSSEISYLIFQGNYQLWTDGYSVPGVKRIQLGSYDIYTGALAWLNDDYYAAGGEQKLVTGFVDELDTFKLFWPGDRVPYAAGMIDRYFGTYRRTDQ